MTAIWSGSKVKLRPVMKEDLNDYFNASQVDSNIQRLAGQVTFPIRQKMLECFVEDVVNKDGSDDVFYFIIEDKEGNAVGDLNTSDCNKRNGTFKYGLALKNEYWNKGYGTEAVNLVLNFYFNELRYQKVTISVYSFNEASYLFHRRLGFTQEGRLRQMVYVNGDYHDEIVLGMTKDEFNAKKYNHSARPIHKIKKA